MFKSLRYNLSRCRFFRMNIFFALKLNFFPNTNRSKPSKMITPSFKISQDNGFIFITIKAPYAKVNDL